MEKKAKALVLLSGGLDSRLALMMMKDQLGKENVEAVHFVLPFEGCSHRKKEVIQFAKQHGIKIYILNCMEGQLLKEYIKILRHPKFGRGTALNPCIDCHIFLLKEAKKIARKIKADIVVTGEVIGERPMSQRRNILYLIEKESGLKGKLLRPLSAKLLPPTDAEKKGLIDRNKLEGIAGRQRKRQIELAEKYGISYPNPAGGCLLCYPDFCKKVLPVLKSRKNITGFDIELFKVGRHFENGNIILGKSKEENGKLEYISKKYKKGIIIIPNQPGPAALIRNWKYIRKAKELIKNYSKRTITSFDVVLYRTGKRTD
ncbi:MAG: tRNA 4-thiouridine(8) synthase ThiI [Candidatus Omnitrophica bacterium]|nr:tRNA 4-thiouridine(8) synthase ThiI [Candidatus Omnitrophota bacterium]